MCESASFRMFALSRFALALQPRGRLVNRLFLAVALPDPVRDALRSAIGTTFPEGVPGRAVPPESWHLTLRFLGDTAPDAASRLTRSLAAADLGAPFDLAFASLGAFPRPERAAVIWVGVASGAPELVTLARRVEQCVRDAGFAAEHRPFSAHLTLSRLRPPANVAPLLARPTGAPIRMRVREVVLYRSHLGGGPARYEAVARYPLG